MLPARTVRFCLHRPQRNKLFAAAEETIKASLALYLFRRLSSDNSIIVSMKNTDEIFSVVLIAFAYAG